MVLLFSTQFYCEKQKDNMYYWVASLKYNVPHSLVGFSSSTRRSYFKLSNARYLTLDRAQRNLFIEEIYLKKCVEIVSSWARMVCFLFHQAVPLKLLFYIWFLWRRVASPPPQYRDLSLLGKLKIKI